MFHILQVQRIGRQKAASSPVAHYYVAVNGSDSNGNGTQERPWRTIARADSKLSQGSGGTIVHVLPGTYSFGYFITRTSGRANSRVVWRSEEKWGAKLVSSGWVVSGNYVDIDGFEIGPDADATNGWAALEIRGNYVRATNNYLHHKGDDQISCPGSGLIAIMSAAHDALIDANLLYSTGRRGGCRHSYGWGASNHGIYIAGYHNTVTNNLISKAAGVGIHAYHNPCQNVIANNTIFYNYTSGIQIAAPADKVFPCGASGDADTSITNNLVVHNGWGCQGSTNHNGGIFFGMSGIGMGNRAYNNLMAGNLDQSCRPANTIDVYPGQRPPAQGGNISRASYEDLFVHYRDEYTGNPADYQLSSNSPAKDAGVGSSTAVCAEVPGISPCVPATDFLGSVRPQGKTYDIGAYERFTSQK